jgi:hypothetical protein
MKNLIFAFGILIFLTQCHADKDLVTPVNPTSPSQEYLENPENMHYIVMNVADESKVPAIKEKVKKFNTANGFENLRLSNIRLIKENSSDHILVIRRFENFSLAKDYITTFNKKLGEEKLYALTQANYRTLLRKRDMKEYEDFYEKINSGD